MNIEEFQQKAASAFPNAWDVKAEIGQWKRLDDAPTYRVVVIPEKGGEAASGNSRDPQQAINNCQHALATANADRIEAARALVAKHGP